MDYFTYISDSHIQITNTITAQDFIKTINKIKNFTELFDPFEIDPNPKNGDCYELTYDDKHYLTTSGIKCLIKDIIKVCENYKYKLCLKIFIMYDGQYDLYQIIKNNKCHDITDNVNKVVQAEETKVHEYQ